MKHTNDQKAPFFTRLLRDTTANTMAMAAAAVVPLIGVVGGGVDASRMYLVQARLQQACDAATLAARKELGGGSISNGSIPQNIRDTADRFFEVNFTDGKYGTSNTSYTLSAPSTRQMDGVASVDVPMTLMNVFGYETSTVNVECTAELRLPNIDVALVLDVSGSMGGQRIADLKSAVFDFYDEVMGAKPDEARFRIAVVPYNSAVNVGSVLYNEDPDWIADSWTYQSREAQSYQEQTGTETIEGEWEEYSYARQLIPRNRNHWTRSNPNLRWRTNNNGRDEDDCNALGQGSGTEYFVGDERWIIDSDHFIENYFTNGNRNRRAACDVRIRKFRRGEGTEVPVYETRWRYIHQAMTFDTSTFKTFANVQTPTGSQGSFVTSSWNGCIEERQMTQIGNTNGFDPIPATSFDLDINMVPNPANPATQWKPMWPQITYNRTTGLNPQTYNSAQGTRSFDCPQAARKLTEYPMNGSARNANFQSYINSLNAGGNTMHPVGILWGARLIAPNGIFSAENATAPNGEPISRHLIFMTDGQMAISASKTTTFGNYDMDERFAGRANDGSWSSNQLNDLKNAQMDAICSRVKNENITVWVVTFGTSLTTRLRNCATGDRAEQANNGTQLSEAFREIARSIAELRLTD